MRKSFIIAAFAALTLAACNNNKKSSSDNNSGLEQSVATAAINQDSIDKSHGHSHNPSGGHAAPLTNQDSIDKSHGAYTLV